MTKRKPLQVLNIFDILPIEVLIMILSQLHPTEIVRLGGTDKTLRRITKEAMRQGRDIQGKKWGCMTPKSPYTFPPPEILFNYWGDVFPLCFTGKISKIKKLLTSNHLRNFYYLDFKRTHIRVLKDLANVHTLNLSETKVTDVSTLTNVHIPPTSRP